jgi:hypothetical protein
MPDWQQLVRDRLSQLDLDPAEREEVCAELAAHLEDDYQDGRAGGASERAAARRALRQVNHWQELKSQIESARKKELSMNNRVRQFWFPAFSTILLAMVILMVIEEIGPKPWISPAWGGSPRMTPLAVVYSAWLMTLPFIGALGAWISRRAGGSPRTVLCSVIFPVLPYLAFFVIGLPVAVILDDRVAHNIMLPAFFTGFAAWVLVPALALLAGALPMQYFLRRSATQRVANG